MLWSKVNDDSERNRCVSWFIWSSLMSCSTIEREIRERFGNRAVQKDTYANLSFLHVLLWSKVIYKNERNWWNLV